MNQIAHTIAIDLYKLVCSISNKLCFLYWNHLKSITSWWFQHCFNPSAKYQSNSQIGNLPQIGVKIKNVWNRHLDHNRSVLHRHQPRLEGITGSRRFGRLGASRRFVQGWMMIEVSYKQTNKQTNKQMFKRTNEWTNKQTSKQANEQTNKQTNKQTQTNSQTNKQTGLEGITEGFYQSWILRYGQIVAVTYRNWM